MATEVLYVNCGKGGILYVNVESWKFVTDKILYNKDRRTPMKSFRFTMIFALIITGIATFFYLLHYLIFQDSAYIMKDLISQLAFMPVFYFLSTMILDRVIEKKEIIEKARKLNLLVGLFFSEFGSMLIEKIARFEKDFSIIQERMRVDDNWNAGDFSEAQAFLQRNSSQIDTQLGDLEQLKTYLLKNRHFLVSALENQYIQEHEAFSELLMALFHLCDEMKFRESFQDLPNSDLNHLAGDIRRVTDLLLLEWICYLEHLKSEYPYMFSLAVRSNPFKQGKSVIIQ